MMSENESTLWDSIKNEPTLWGGIGGKTGRDHPKTRQQAGRRVKSGSGMVEFVRDFTGVILERETTPSNTGQVQKASDLGIQNAL